MPVVFHLFAALADEYRLLALFLHPQGRGNVQHALLAFKFFDLHRHRVRYLLTETAKHLLPYQLGGQEAFAAVGDLVFRIHRRLQRQQFDKRALERVHVLAAQRRHRHDLGETEFFRRQLDQRQ